MPYCPYCKETHKEGCKKKVKNWRVHDVLVPTVPNAKKRMKKWREKNLNHPTKGA